MAVGAQYLPGAGSPFKVGTGNTFLTFTLVELAKVNQNLMEMGNDALRAASVALQDRIVSALSLDDHSLVDLEMLDHPYARRHGSIRLHKDRPWLVHKQSGRLLKSLYRQELAIGGKLAIDIGLDPSVAPHVVDVIMGTKRMLPRDVLWERAQQKATKMAMMRAIVVSLSQRKGQLGVRFGESKPSRGTLVAVTGVRVGNSATFP